MKDEPPKPSQTKRSAALEEWTRLRSIIMRLYLDEEKTLDQVRQYMEENHDFSATVSMYKKKLAAWNAFKNLRVDEVLQILRLKKDRDAAQKQSIFFIRNREVDHESLQVYLSRNPSIYTKLEAGTQPSPDAVRDVTCRSPSLNSTYSSSSSQYEPTTLCNRLLPTSEDMFRAASVYINRCFETHIWSWSESHCWNTRGRGGPTELLNALLDRCMTAALSVNRRVEPVAVRKALDAPFTLLVRVFRNPPPNFIPKLLSAVAHLGHIGREEIQSILLQFCRDLAVALFGRTHPLARFWQGLREIPLAEQQDAIGRTLALCVSVYEEHVGASHALPTEVYLQYFDVIGRNKDPKAQILRLERQLSKVDDDLTDRPVLGLLQLEHALATCKLNMEQGDLDAAEEALFRLDADALTPKDESFRRVWLGYVQWVKGDLPRAERSYVDAVLAARQTGSRDCVCEALYQLETFYLQTGEPLEAERIRAERFQVLRRLDAIVWTDYHRHLSGADGSCTDTGPRVAFVHFGSGANSADWRPAAFSLMKAQDDVSGISGMSNLSLL
ncbi:hypothetical protein F5X96DRAFT_478244 [Biscogniauxia mediterranea]|nr:hypothetical protein F5X96DRAFT_478244 [Biscogniauxia mediterranea]